jgi:hypothetical protein
MNVSKLKTILAEIETLGWGETTVIFSYDSRVCYCDINIVELQTNPEGGMFEEKNLICFRDEEKFEYDWFTKDSLDEGYKQKLIFAEWNNDAD